jgi:hypothetical protein
MTDVVKDVEAFCICKKCSSFIACKEKIGYCHPKIGKSKCIKIERGCICGACPIHEKYMLKSGYYCTRGGDKNFKK